MAWILKGLAQALRWLFEWRCAGCERRQAEPVCESCRTLLSRPRMLMTSGLVVWVGGDFGGPLRRLLFAFKYRGRHDVLARLVEVMLAACPASVTSGCLIVPVPLHPNRLKHRGFNQAALLARRVAAVREVPYLDCLARTTDTRPQWRLTRTERERNLDQTVIGLTAVDNQDVLLIDDVYTTGATARACQRALLRGGARSVQVLVLASSWRTGSSWTSKALSARWRPPTSG